MIGLLYISGKNGDGLLGFANMTTDAGHTNYYTGDHWYQTSHGATNLSGHLGDNTVGGKTASIYFGNSTVWKAERGKWSLEIYRNGRN